MPQSIECSHWLVNGSARSTHIYFAPKTDNTLAEDRKFKYLTVCFGFPPFTVNKLMVVNL